MARRKTAEFGVEPTLRSPGDEPGPRANRTIAKILDAARRVFVTHGYAGTTVDAITSAAGISRASFYTYFPTKRDVLLALGAESAQASQLVVDDFAALGDDLDHAALEAFVDAYFRMLDEHGGFALAWTQAAHEDAEIRAAGNKGHLAICRRFGRAVSGRRSEPLDDPTAFGLVFFSMCERSWDYSGLYGDRPGRVAVQAEAVTVLAATLGI